MRPQRNACATVRKIAATVALLLSAFVAHADAGGDLTGDRPGAGGPPDEVTVILGMVDVDVIHDKDQRFSVDAYVEFRWTDPRLASSAAAGTRALPIGAIWTPRLTVVNDRGLATTLEQLADVDAVGNVVVRQRIAGQLAVDLDLRSFPFDTQVLPLGIISSRYTPEELVFSPDSYMIAKIEQFSARGWRFEAREPEQGLYRLAETIQDSPMLTFSVRAEREPAFYVLTLALPMLLILSMSWMAHWLPPDLTQQRLGLSTATVFSLITLGLGFRLTLPKVSYLTQADLFIIYSSVLILLSLSTTVIAGRWVRLERTDAAERLSRLVLRAYPLGVLLVLALTFAG